jgi:hypothetical protein
MKHYIFLLATFALSHAASAQNKDSELLKKLNEEWISSYPTKDTLKMNSIFADDFVLINPSGVKMTKRDIFSNLAHSTNPVLTAKVDSVEIRLFHNIGIVNAKASFTFKSGEAGKTCYMDVYEKRAGKWVAVAAHVTSLQ